MFLHQLIQDDFFRLVLFIVDVIASRRVLGGVDSLTDHGEKLKVPGGLFFNQSFFREFRGSIQSPTFS